jgi:hypothetical protein
VFFTGLGEVRTARSRLFLGKGLHHECTSPPFSRHTLVVDSR